LRISSATTFTQNDGCRNAQSARRLEDMFVLAILAGALSSASAATLVAAYTIQHPFRVRLPIAPAVYLNGEEASEHGRMSNWLRCRATIELQL
jgi:hypothetical protein